MVNKKMAAVVLGAATATTVVVAATRNRERLSGHKVTLRSITVNRPASVVYQLWRDLPSLASALDRRAEVEVVDDRESRWTIAGPVGSTLHWTARITDEEPDKMLSWRVEDGVLPHEGRLDLVEAPGERGTEIHVMLRYDLPGGALTAAAANLTGDEPDLVLRSCLRRIKQLLECGLVVTTDGQPSGRGPVQERLTRFVQHKLAAGGRP